MAKKRRGRKLLTLFRVVFTCCLVGSVVLIFYHSAEIGELSGGRSAQVTDWLNRMLTRLRFSFQFGEHQVRKLAHFAEYAMLGFWSMLTLRVYTRRLLSHISWPLLFCLIIAVLDESFQLLIPGRAGQLLDVLIDFSGVLAGVCCGLFLLLVFRAFWQELQESAGKEGD